MDIDLVRRKYRRNAVAYDLIERATARLRTAAVQRLRLQPGDTVLDFGCGTGLSFALLVGAVGAEGRVVGVDISPDMLTRARARVEAHSWLSVTLVEANAEAAPVAAESADAVLCLYTHDIITSPLAVRTAVGALRSGGRFVAAGVKRAGGFRGLLLDPITLAYSLPAITRTESLDRPWAELERLLGALVLEERGWGTAYIASGRKAPGTGQRRPDSPARTVQGGR
jgi:ubiquinone/menaquinone biosynthesis C-methylase UbiE